MCWKSWNQTVATPLMRRNCILTAFLSVLQITVQNNLHPQGVRQMSGMVQAAGAEQFIH